MFVVSKERIEMPAKYEDAKFSLSQLLIICIVNLNPREFVAK